MTDTSLRNSLEFIVKSHACTQVNFDKYASEDYPKMIDAILKIIDEEVRKGRVELFNRLYDSAGQTSDPLEGAQKIIHELNTIRTELTGEHHEQA